jgi:segregation and condensation protein B
MMTHALTNGHVSSEVVEVGSPENEDSLDVEVNGNSVGEQTMPDESIQETHWDLEDIKATFEALLFVSHDPLTMEKLAAVLEGVPKPTLKTTMQALQDEYEQVGRGSSTKLSRSALEAMAIISYKQPITRSEIEKIRGVETSGVLRTLLDQKMIRIVGRKEIPGRPILYGTGKQFLQRFGLRDLRDLPPLKELKDLGASESLSLELPFDSQEDPEESRVADLSA